jgi:hypothetical protein
MPRTYRILHHITGVGKPLRVGEFGSCNPAAPKEEPPSAALNSASSLAPYSRYMCFIFYIYIQNLIYS